MNLLYLVKVLPHMLSAMLIGSHFAQDTETELDDNMQWFAQSPQSICHQCIAQQLVLLFSHDEVRSTCAYTK